MRHSSEGLQRSHNQNGNRYQNEVMVPMNSITKQYSALTAQQWTTQTVPAQTSTIYVQHMGGMVPQTVVYQTAYGTPMGTVVVNPNAAITTPIDINVLVKTFNDELAKATKEYETIKASLEKTVGICL